MDIFIPISPITKQQTIIYSQMKITVMDWAISTNGATIDVAVYDEAKEFMKRFQYGLVGEDYIKWTDDNWLIEWVKQKLRGEIF